MVQENKRMYEGMFLVDSAAAASNWDDVESELQRVFERASVEVLNLQKWDDRRLCYDIAGHKRGTYILTYFNAEPDRISGIERDVKLNETLLRVMILRADRIPESIRETPTPYAASLKPTPERTEDETTGVDQTNPGNTESGNENELSVPEKVAIAEPDKIVEGSSDSSTEAEASDETKKFDIDPSDSENS